MYFINTGKNNGIEELLDSIEQGLTTYFVSESSQLVLLFNVAILLFIQEDFPGCKKWCRKLFAKKKVSSRVDIQKAARLLYLISEYEIDDMDGPEKALRSVGRYLQAQDHQANSRAFENLVMTTIQKLIFAPLMEKKTIFRDFKEQIKSFTQEHKVPLGLDELFIIWVNGKLEKKQMSHLLNT